LCIDSVPNLDVIGAFQLGMILCGILSGGFCADRACFGTGRRSIHWYLRLTV
jgi:hypothetical protein